MQMLWLLLGPVSLKQTHEQSLSFVSIGTGVVTEISLDGVADDDLHGTLLFDVGISSKGICGKSFVSCGQLNVPDSICPNNKARESGLCYWQAIEFLKHYLSVAFLASSFTPSTALLAADLASSPASFSFS